MPSSPSSFTMTATRVPPPAVSSPLTKVVLPLPRNPVTIVTGSAVAPVTGGRAPGPPSTESASRVW